MRQSFSEYFYFLNELSNKVVMKIEAWEKAALGFLRKEREEKIHALNSLWLDVT